MLEEWIKYILHCDPTFYLKKKIVLHRNVSGNEKKN